MIYTISVYFAKFFFSYTGNYFNTGIKNCWIENPWPIADARLPILMPIAGIFLSSFGLETSNHIKNAQYKVMLITP